MNLAHVPRRNPRVSARVVNGTALVVVLERRELHRLNRVGARVWELCDGRTLQEIQERIAREFDAPTTAIEADLQVFVEQLQRLGALSLDAPADDATPGDAGRPGATGGSPS